MASASRPPTTRAVRRPHAAPPRNLLRALPDSLTQLTRLEHLAVSHNLLAELPADLAAGLGGCLQHLDAEANRLTALPHRLAAMTVLRRLELGQNLCAEVPPGKGAISCCYYSAGPPALGAMLLQGHIVSAIGSITALGGPWNRIHSLP